jgi:DNA-binding NarL/FixJ family response regulator
MYMENWFVEQLLNHDVKGFVSKSSKITELIHAVHNVNDGLNYYCPQFKAKFGVQSVQTENKNHKLDSLTNYELQIMKQFADDLKKKEIAQKLNLSNEMMDSMIANILLKVNAANEYEIIQIAKRQKFVSE